MRHLMGTCSPPISHPATNVSTMVCCRTFKEEASAWGQQQAQSLEGLTATPRGVSEMFSAWDDAGVYSLFDNHIDPVLTALWSSGRLGQHYRLEKVSGEGRVTGSPDRCIVSQSGKVLVLIQIKHRYALPPGAAPLHSLQLSPPGTDKSVLQKHVEQLYGYVVGNGELRT